MQDRSGTQAVYLMQEIQDQVNKNLQVGLEGCQPTAVEHCG